MSLVLLTLTLLGVLAAWADPFPGGAPPSCQIDGRFAQLVPLLPDRSGACTAAATRDPAIGDVIQPTAAGLLVFRQADQRAAFTDGDRTWILGPDGLGVRPNNRRFPWEADAAAHPLAVDARRGALPGAAAALPPVPDGVPFLGRLLIADRLNRRVIEVAPTGAITWRFPTPGRALPVPFGPPDDTFYTPDFRGVVANSEDGQTVTAIDVRSGSILWQAGIPGERGAGPGRFNSPDDAVPALDGTVTVADIRNCRLVRLSARGSWLGALGTGRCAHDPPRAFAAPNGAFPTADGGLVVTEIGGSWVDWLNADASLRWSARAPVWYPSDAVPLPDGSVLLTDYSRPGRVVRMAPTGQVLWQFAPTGVEALDHPSIAIPLAANRVAVCDDRDDRVLVVDPTTNAVVWQFSGQGSTRLSGPDGLAYRPA